MTGNEPIRVGVADAERTVFRRGVVEVLSAEADLHLVELIGGGADDDDRIASLTVLLIDPAAAGAGVERVRRAAAQGIAVLALGAFAAGPDLDAAIEAGAAGVLARDVGPAELVAAVRHAAAGRGVVSPSLVRPLLERQRALLRVSARDDGPGPRLTRREREVLDALVRGRSNRAIAEDLFISENTVKNHVRNLFEKLGVHSRSEAAWWASQHGTSGTSR